MIRALLCRLNIHEWTEKFGAEKKLQNCKHCGRWTDETLRYWKLIK